MLYVLKVLISALVIVAVTELSKRGGSFWGGLLASLPITSVLALAWLYRDTGDVEKVVDLSRSILWLVVPSLSLFAVLPQLLRRGVAFPLAIAGSLLIMSVAYLLVAVTVRRFGVAI